MPMLTMSAKNLSTGGTDPVEKDDSRKRDNKQNHAAGIIRIFSI